MRVKYKERELPHREYIPTTTRLHKHQGGGEQTQKKRGEHQSNFLYQHNICSDKTSPPLPLYIFHIRKEGVVKNHLRHQLQI